MWKIFLFQILFALMQSSYAADVYCSSMSTSACQIDHMNNVASANDAINVVGQSSSFLDNASWILDLNQTSQFSYFPKNFFNTFPKISVVKLSNNSLSNLVSNNFVNSILQVIQLQNQLFTNLPAAFAQGCTTLNSIYISNCPLATLDPNALLGLTTLAVIEVTNTKITCIPPGFFLNTPSIASISFMSSQITSIDPLLFKGLPKLYYAQLNGNQISYIPNIDLTGTGIVQSIGGNNTPFISFQDNPIKAIYPQLLDNVFSTRNTSIQINAGSSSLSTCFPFASFTVNNINWSTAKSSLSTCFSAWTSAMDNTPVPCASIVTTPSPTSPPTVPATLSTPTLSPTVAPITPIPPSPPCNLQPCTNGQKRVLEIILSEFRNMSFNVNFN